MMDTLVKPSEDLKVSIIEKWVNYQVNKINHD